MLSIIFSYINITYKYNSVRLGEAGVSPTLMVMIIVFRCSIMPKPFIMSTFLLHHSNEINFQLNYVSKDVTYSKASFHSGGRRIVGWSACTRLEMLNSPPSQNFVLTSVIYLEVHNVFSKC